MSLSVKRILIDLMDVFEDPIKDVLVYFDEANIHEVTVILIGSQGTPYDGGFFPFFVKFTNSYPSDPPKVTFLTPNERVRFHPNLYETGKVCLSILGTWTGPEWKSVMNLRSLILSLQSILNEHPLRNEPGFELESTLSRRNQNYNTFVQFVTIKYAIIDTINNMDKVRKLEDKINDYVKNNKERYTNILHDTIPSLLDNSGNDCYLLRTMYNMKASIDTQELTQALTKVVSLLC